MKFFFDRNVSVHIARMMSHFERLHNVVHQDDDKRFVGNDDDVVLINTVANESPKPVYLTADLNQYRKNPTEREALRNSGMCLVFFRAGFHNLEFHHQALKVLAVWPSLVRHCETAREPTVFDISNKVHSDKVDVLGPSAEFLA